MDNLLYWNDEIPSFPESESYDHLWRAYMRGVYKELIERWMDTNNRGMVLKTDLYDEAISRYNLLSVLSEKYKTVVGIDISIKVANAAMLRTASDPECKNNIMVSDVRKMAIKSCSFDAVLSNSTLDHFSLTDDIILSIREIHRLLKDKGELIITLDNPSNPVVSLRNLLPYRILKAFGVIPFYMGKTLSSTELIDVLRAEGFYVSESTAIIHFPRIIGIWIEKLLNKAGLRRINKYFYKFIRLFDYFEKTPLRYITGYFVAVKAVKNGDVA